MKATNRRTPDEVATRSRRYTYKLLLAIKKGEYPAQIARHLKTPENTIKSRIKRLIKIKYIKEDLRTCFVIYRLLPKGYNYIKRYNDDISRYLRGKNKTRLHRLNIKFPITDNNLKVTLQKSYSLNNWIQEYSKVVFPIGITIKRTPKSIIAMFHEFETTRGQALTDFFSHIFRGTYYLYYYLKKEKGITIDIFEGILTDQHLVNESPELKDIVDKKKTTMIDLARKAKSVFPTIIGAKAWLDHSKGLPEIETNDFLYEEKLLLMPENIEKLANTLTPAIVDLTKQINLHLVIQKETLEVLKEIRGYFKNGNKQTKKGRRRKNAL